MDNIPKISEAEYEVMKVLWQENPLTSEEIIDKLSEKNQWSGQTIKTFITRLSKKKALSYEKKGRIYYYYPLISEKEALSYENNNFLKRVYNGAVGLLISNFVNNNKLTLEDINEIEKILNEKKYEFNNENGDDV